MRCNRCVAGDPTLVHVPCFRQVLDSSVEMWTEALLCSTTQRCEIALNALQ